MEVFSTVIFILELAALAGLVICVALLILNTGSRAKDKPEQPEQIKGRYNIYYPLDKKRKCKRRPKGQTGRKHPKGKRKV